MKPEQIVGRIERSLRWGAGRTATALIDYFAAAGTLRAPIERMYSINLSETRRATLRDAVLRALELAAQRQDALDLFVGLTRLADSVGLLSLGPGYTEARLWRLAHKLQRASPDCAALLLALAATDGPVYDPQYWTAARRHFGAVSSAACLEGVMRLGVPQALAWIDRIEERSERSLLLVAKYPEMARIDPPGILDYRQRASPRFIGELDEWSVELELGLARRERVSSRSQTAGSSDFSSRTFERFASEMKDLRSVTRRSGRRGTAAFAGMMASVAFMDDNADAARDSLELVLARIE